MQTFYGVEVTPGKTSAFVPPPIDAQLHLSQVRSVLFLTYYSLPKDETFTAAQCVTAQATARKSFRHRCQHCAYESLGSEIVHDGRHQPRCDIMLLQW